MFRLLRIIVLLSIVAAVVLFGGQWLFVSAKVEAEKNPQIADERLEQFKDIMPKEIPAMKSLGATRKPGDMLDVYTIFWNEKFESPGQEGSFVELLIGKELKIFALDRELMDAYTRYMETYRSGRLNYKGFVAVEEYSVNPKKNCGLLVFVEGRYFVGARGTLVSLDTLYEVVDLIDLDAIRSDDLFRPAPRVEALDLESVPIQRVTAQRELPKTEPASQKNSAQKILKSREDIRASFFEMLPDELAGFEQVSHYDLTDETDSSGEIQILTNYIDPRQGDSHIQVTLTYLGEPSGRRRTELPTWVTRDFYYESQIRFGRTMTYKNLRGQEKYDNKKQTGSIDLMITDKVLLSIHGTKTTMEAIRAVLDQIDLDKTGSLM
ncbi:MAG: hypothetical protein JW860_05505 [Sedimentisphaerales bacterium]|nr:hypothetical protein [Sedimentisphaerales bacterium]